MQMTWTTVMAGIFCKLTCAVNAACKHEERAALQPQTLCMRRATAHSHGRGTADCYNQVAIHQYVISCIIRLYPSINQSILVVLSGAACSQMSSHTHASKFQIRIG